MASMSRFPVRGSCGRYPTVPVLRTAPAGRLGLPGEHLGQRGLPGSVPADQADPVPRGHLERRAFQQQARASPQFDFTCHDHD